MSLVVATENARGQTRPRCHDDRTGKKPEVCVASTFVLRRSAQSSLQQPRLVDDETLKFVFVLTERRHDGPSA